MTDSYGTFTVMETLSLLVASSVAVAVITAVPRTPVRVTTPD